MLLAAACVAPPGGFRPFWERGVQVPRVGRASSRDVLDEAVLQILQTTPISSTARFRRVVGAATAANSRGFERYQDIQADLLNQIVGPHFGISRVPKIAEFVTDRRSHRLSVPWVQAAEGSETEPLQPNYVAEILVYDARQAY